MFRPFQIYLGQISLYYYSFSSGRDTSVTLASSPFLLSGRDLIFQANTPLLYSVLYYRPFSLGRNTSVALVSSLFLPSGYNSTFRANTFLLYSTLYHRPFSSGRNPLVILASCPLSRAASILLLLVTNLSFRVTPYYGLVL
jgi:hypothetical protein